MTDSASSEIDEQAPHVAVRVPTARSPDEPRPASFRLPCTSRRDSRSAGTSPNSTPAPIETISVNSSTRASIAISCRRGTLFEPKMRIHCTLHTENTSPSAPPASASTHAFDEELRDDAAAAGAEGDAHGDLALTRQRARQQQVGDVRARDQQDEADGAGENQHGAAHAADHLFLQRHDAEREAAVRWIHFGMIARGAARSAHPSPPAPASTVTPDFSRPMML